MCETFPPNQREACDIPRTSIKVGAENRLRRSKTALRWKGNPKRRQRIQMVLLRESGMSQPAIAEAMGVSLSTVNRAHMAYDHGGLTALKSKPSGVSRRPTKRPSGTRWRKLMPRRFHPKRDIAAQNAFKNRFNG